uniref:gp16 family protein n=1 Tax=Marinobacterium profundum TaxID=1714300 RepID=UPI00082CB75C|nr:regulatory protein GemA [Marinobacterium profundum]
MKHPQKDNRKAALAQIHIGKKQLALDDDSYRDMLQGLTGLRSCSDMTLAQLYQVITQLQAAGFKAKGGAPRRSKGYYSPKSQGQLIDVMRARWIQMHQMGIVNDGSESALTAYALRMSSQINGGVGIARLEWLEREPKIAAKVLEALKKWHIRQYRSWKQQDIATVQQACSLNPELSAAQVIRQLLQQQRIFWYREFEDYSVQDSPEYCTNRKELQHD